MPTQYERLRTYVRQLHQAGELIHGVFKTAREIAVEAAPWAMKNTPEVWDAKGRGPKQDKYALPLLDVMEMLGWISTKSK